MTSPQSVTPDERRRVLEQIAAEVTVCMKCPLGADRTLAVPGEGHPDTEVVFIGEGPGYNEDQQGRPFVGAAGTLLNELLAPDWLEAPGGFHHQRRQVPAARQPRPGAVRDRGVRAVPQAPARRARSGRRRDARPPLAGLLQSRGAHRRDARHAASCRSSDRRTQTPCFTRCTTRPRRSARAASSRRCSRTCAAYPTCADRSRARAARAEPASQPRTSQPQSEPRAPCSRSPQRPDGPSCRRDVAGAIEPGRRATSSPS